MRYAAPISHRVWIHGRLASPAKKMAISDGASISDCARVSRRGSHGVGDVPTSTWEYRNDSSPPWTTACDRRDDADTPTLLRVRRLCRDAARTRRAAPLCRMLPAMRKGWQRRLALDGALRRRRASPSRPWSPPRRRRIPTRGRLSSSARVYRRGADILDATATTPRVSRKTPRFPRVCFSPRTPTRTTAPPRAPAAL